MRITLFAHGTRGDIWPMVALGAQLAGRDHDVTIALPEESRALADGAGVRSVPLPFNIITWLALPEGQHLLHTGGAAFMRGLHRAYTRHADALDTAYESAARGAEALVAMHLTFDRAQVLGDLLGIPMATVYPLPVSPSGDYASLGLTTGALQSPRLRRVSHDAAHRIWWHGSAATTKAFRRKLGVPACSVSTFGRQQHPGALALHTVSPSIFPRPTDWADTLKLTGAWQLPQSVRAGAQETFPRELEQWLAAGEAPIYLGFGSMPVLDPDTLLDDIVAVTDKLGARAIVDSSSLQGRHRAAALPDRIRFVGPTDHDKLFPHCAAVVHHGGCGSTTASLRAGRPTMICSVFGDQPWWGEHMKRLGVGTHVPFRKLDRARLEAGLRVLLTGEVTASALALGQAIDAEGDGLPAATTLLDDWLVTAEPTPYPRRRGRRPLEHRR